MDSGLPPKSVPCMILRAPTRQCSNRKTRRTLGEREAVWAPKPRKAAPGVCSHGKQQLFVFPQELLVEE